MKKTRQDSRDPVYVSAYNKYYHKKNRKRILQKQKEWRTKNPERKKQQATKWNNSERGFIMNMYTSIRQRCTKPQQNRKFIPVKLTFTKEEFWNHWVAQKMRYGMRCPYSKVEMTFIRGKGKKIPTNVSADQIWPGKGYTPENIVFCSSLFNNNKASITPDGCQAVVDIYEDRMKETMFRKFNLEQIIIDDDNIHHYRKAFKEMRKGLTPLEIKTFIKLTYNKMMKEKEEEQKRKAIYAGPKK
jgi:hypothetical protein|tara:strand:+ start:443 stop:1171 length:729 start_codon:yes stop_codon:yes gene_type:complete